MSLPSRNRIVLTWLACAALGCASSPPPANSTATAPPPPSSTAQPETAQPEAAQPEAAQPAAAQPGATQPSAAQPPAAGTRTGNATSSRSGGQRGGVVVLWPRIVPSATQPPQVRQLAARVQTHLRAVAGEALPGRPIDVRPEPERVCPPGGCEGVSVGAVVAHSQGGCALVAIVAPRGQSGQRLIAWLANVTLKQDTAPFEAPAESYVVVRDYLPCTDLGAKLDTHRTTIVAAIRAAAR